MRLPVRPSPVSPTLPICCVSLRVCVWVFACVCVCTREEEEAKNRSRNKGRCYLW